MSEEETQSDVNLKTKKDESCTSKVLSFVVLAPLVGSIIIWIMIGFEVGLKWLYGVFTQNEILFFVMDWFERFFSNLFPFTVNENEGISSFIFIHPKLFLPLFLIIIFMSFLSILISSTKTIFKKLRSRDNQK